MKDKLRDLLAEGDKRTVRKVDAAFQLLCSHPALLEEIIEMIQGASEALAMRAADCLEKFNREHVDQVEKYKDDLIHILVEVSQKEVRWHLAQILPRLQLSQDDLEVASKVWIHDFYNSKSAIVRVESLQALFNIRDRYAKALPELKKALESAASADSPAVKTRAAILIRSLH